MPLPFQPSDLGYWTLLKKYWVGIAREHPVFDKKLNKLVYTEITGKAYRRVHLNQNTRTIPFPRARDEWGIATGLLVYSSQTGDEVLAYMPFHEPIMIKHKDYINPSLSDSGICFNEPV